MTIAYINGQILQDDEVKISPFDLGFLRGFGVFEYFRTYEKQPHKLFERYLRLSIATKKLGIQIPLSFDELETITSNLLKETTWDESTIRIIVTGGQSEDEFHPEGPPSLMIFVKQLTPMPLEWYEKGIAAITTKKFRAGGPIKSLNYLTAMLALKEAEEQGAQEALYLDENKAILEGAMSNFFAVQNGELVTSNAPEILPGITKKIVLKIAHGTIPIRYQNIPLSALDTLSEAFTTSSIKEIIPITSIDGKPIGTGRVGKITTHLMQLYADQ